VVRVVSVVLVVTLVPVVVLVQVLVVLMVEGLGPFPILVGVVLVPSMMGRRGKLCSMREVCEGGWIPAI
jgi:hypothetical protein